MSASHPPAVPTLNPTATVRVNDKMGGILEARVPNALCLPLGGLKEGG
jgi:hypothetical protein